jgi:hypothetical protein
MPRSGRRPTQGTTGSAQDRKAERIYAAARAITETDAQETQAKMDRLRALRLAKEAVTEEAEDLSRGLRPGG